MAGHKHLQQRGPQTYAELPTEIPADFVPTADGFDFERREEMIPMRDGVKLHTVILVPKGEALRTDPVDAYAV